MGVKIALCQVRPSVGEVGSNLKRIISVISQTAADVYIFPELFLTGYGAEYKDLEDDIQYAVDKLKIVCGEHDIAVATGVPSFDSDGMKNSLLFVTQNSIVRYDKLYPAKFGIYKEDMFSPGKRPAIAEFKGMKFGLSICYDLFFPEIFRHYAISGADATICISASADPSREYFERIAPARSLENVMYTIFVNNTGKCGNIRFFGRSRLMSPLGETISVMNDEDSVRCVYIDKAVVEHARKERRHLDDLRNDIDWQ